jgi:hypothetical protein
MATDKKTLKCNKPRRTPDHKTKSHIVKACQAGKEKIIRFGQQGVTTAGKPKVVSLQSKKHDVLVLKLVTQRILKKVKCPPPIGLTK